MNIIIKLLSPSVKRFIKIWFHKFYRLKNGKNPINTALPLEVLGEKKTDVFFGYYDISPYSPDNSSMIFHKRRGNKVEICLIDLNSKQEKIIGTTKAWNWQQGARLRWIDKKWVSFNDYDGSYINRMINIANGEEKQIKYPLYDVNKEISLGLSLDFERLGYLRPGYGYRNENISPALFGDEGINIIDMVTGQIIQKINISQIHKLFSSKCSLSNVYINHLSFAPNGKKFLFFLIEIINGYHKASLIVYDILTKEFHILERDYKVSHYVWKDDDRIICTAYEGPNKCRYFEYCVSSKERSIILPHLLSEDGHPSFLNSSMIITDTYPDKFGFQYLYTVDLSDSHKNILLSIYSEPVIEGEKRTDLHPRLSHDKRTVCIDARVKDSRKIYQISLK